MSEQEKTTRFFYWLGNIASHAKEIKVAKAALTPQIKEVINFNEMVNAGSYHGVMIRIVPDYEVVR